MQGRYYSSRQDSMCHGQLAVRARRLHWRTSRQWHSSSCHAGDCGLLTQTKTAVRLCAQKHLEAIRITPHPLASPHSTNPPLGCAFAAPFGKGGRQPRSGWRGDFCPQTYLWEGFSDRHLVCRNLFPFDRACIVMVEVAVVNCSTMPCACLNWALWSLPRTPLIGRHTGSTALRAIALIHLCA
jgi:hypothetical protein